MSNNNHSDSNYNKEIEEWIYPHSIPVQKLDMLTDENKKRKQIAVESVIQFCFFIFHTAINNLSLQHKEKVKEGSSNYWCYSDPIEKSIKIEKQKRELKHILIKLVVLVHHNRYLVCKVSTMFSIFDRHR